MKKKHEREVASLKEKHDREMADTADNLKKAHETQLAVQALQAQAMIRVKEEEIKDLKKERDDLYKATRLLTQERDRLAMDGKKKDERNILMQVTHGEEMSKKEREHNLNIGKFVAANHAFMKKEGETNKQLDALNAEVANLKSKLDAEQKSNAAERAKYEAKLKKFGIDRMEPEDGVFALLFIRKSGIMGLRV